MKTFLIFFITLLSMQSFAVTYTKSSGAYTSAAGWTPSYPGTTIDPGDVVIINGNITLNDDIKVEGTLTINASASLSGNKEIEEVKAGGVLNVNGTLDIKKIDKIKGTANFNGTVEVDDKMKIEDNGVVNIGSSGTFTGDEIEVKDDGSLTINGILTLTDKLKIKDDGEVDFNNGSSGTINDIELEDDGELEIKAGADLTVPNDLKVKDDGKLTIAGTVTVEDDIEFEDDAVVNITGVLNLCDDDGTEDDNKFDVDNDVVLTGVGIFCMCNSNDDNDYDNNSNSQGSITYNQNCNGPLPIELTKFEGKLKDNNAVEVIWETQSEINNEKFQLQYSVDGKGWNVIDEIQGAGTSNRKHKYSYQHDISEIRNNLIYYRLKNFDYDGKSNNSEIISVELSKTELPSEKTKLSLIALYPNPNLQSDKLILNVNNTQLVQGIEFYSLDGRKEEVKWTISDAESIELNHENISAGLYKVLILGDKVQLQTSLMIINY